MEFEPIVNGAREGSRTPTVARQILSLVRLPIPPPSHKRKVKVMGKGVVRQDKFWLTGIQLSGAGSRDRTGTVSLPRDFKSLVSTNSTMPANAKKVRGTQRDAPLTIVAATGATETTLTVLSLIHTAFEQITQI